HVIEFTAPRGTRWIKSVRIHGNRYGGGYDPTATYFEIAICDSDLDPITRTRAEYALFPYARFSWVEIPLSEPVKAPKRFKVVVEFKPTRQKGVFVGWSEGKRSHSAFGTAGGRESPFHEKREWMIRVVLSKKKPKGATENHKKKKTRSSLVYKKDFEFLERTVRTRFPALKKKGVDWKSICKTWRPRFATCKDDETHLLNANLLLAHLGDMHTGITESTITVHVPTTDGLYGGGLWIARDGGRILLRALSPGHPLARKIRPGAELLSVDGRPARLVHEEARHQMRKWSGWSSTHFLDSCLSFRFFPFGKKTLISVEFLNPGGKLVDAKLAQFGPDGRGCSRVAVTMPEGVDPKGKAVSARLEPDLGYVRILGGMNEPTRADFFAAFDEIKGVKGVILDCRGMGGGTDRPAYAMAGRFFPKGGVVPPSGDWQFKGPVVLLQDERQVSSAETFTWVMTESDRVVSVGRHTGGATIVPMGFEVPSGLFKFRMGVSDRRTPIKRVQPEGVGTPPDIFVPYEPYLLAKYGDPIFGIGKAVLQKLVAGEKPGLPPDPERVEADASWAKRLCDERRNAMPDFVGALARLGGSARESWKKEAEAQRAWEVLVAEEFPVPAARRKAFCRKYAGTRYAKATKG
ncbi:MAG: S41 family peptidase, partial [Planctomycetota bacterium]